MSHGLTLFLRSGTPSLSTLLERVVAHSVTELHEVAYLLPAEDSHANGVNSPPFPGCGSCVLYG